MVSIRSLLFVILLFCGVVIDRATCFVPQPKSMPSTQDTSKGNEDSDIHPSQLPGDPSLNLVTNVDLGDQKMDIMKGE